MAMKQLDEILDDLKKRKKNLEKMQKDKATATEFSKDPAKAKILKSLTDLITKIDPLVTETKRLTKLKPDAIKFGSDVDKLNGNRRNLINTFNTLKQDCNNVKADTKDKDFGNLASDAGYFVALNNFEKQ